MSAAAVAALVVTGVLIAALAFFLLWVVVILRRLTDTLGKVVFGVAAIAHRVEPVEQLVTAINSDLIGVADALETLAADLDPGRSTRVMTVEFRCQDVGVACKNVARAESAEELVAAVAKHAKEKHGVELNQTLIDYAVTKVRPKGG